MTMNELQEIARFLNMNSTVITILVIICGFIKIPKLEVNLWSWLAKQIGNIFNQELVLRIEKLESGFLTCSVDMRNELTEYIKRSEEERIDRARSRILRFNDEVMMNEEHSKEHFDEILKDIDKYEAYCDEHKDYENNKAVLAIQTIKEEYKYCLAHNHFLTYTKR